MCHMGCHFRNIFLPFPSSFPPNMPFDWGEKQSRGIATSLPEKPCFSTGRHIDGLTVRKYKNAGQCQPRGNLLLVRGFIIMSFFPSLVSNFIRRTTGRGIKKAFTTKVCQAKIQNQFEQNTDGRKSGCLLAVHIAGAVGK